MHCLKELITKRTYPVVENLDMVDNIDCKGRYYTLAYPWTEILSQRIKANSLDEAIAKMEAILVARSKRTTAWRRRFRNGPFMLVDFVVGPTKSWTWEKWKVMGLWRIDPAPTTKEAQEVLDKGWNEATALEFKTRGPKIMHDSMMTPHDLSHPFWWQHAIPIPYDVHVKANVPLSHIG